MCEDRVEHGTQVNVNSYEGTSGRGSDAGWVAGSGYLSSGLADADGVLLSRGPKVLEKGRSDGLMEGVCPGKIR